MSTAGTVNEALTRIGAGGGKLRYVSDTVLSFKPFMGNTIRVNGALHEIPAAGIVGLANTGVYVNGVAGQNLAVSTTYYVYAFLNGSVLTADYSPTGHSTSAASGNVGTEIKTGDETRSLIGMVRVASDAKFYNSATSRYVISWFNRGEIAMLGVYGGMQQASITASFYDLASNAIYFVTWGDDAVNMNVNGWFANNVVDYCYLNARWDSGAGSLHDTIFSYDIHNTVNYLMTMGEMNAWFLSEGYHSLAPSVRVGSGLGDFYVWVGAMIRG